LALSKKGQPFGCPIAIQSRKITSRAACEPAASWEALPWSATRLSPSS